MADNSPFQTREPNVIENAVQTLPSPEQAAESATAQPESLASKLAREICAPLFWSYVVVKLFVFDCDTYLVDRFLPQLDWLLTFKFLFVLVFLALAWLLAGNQAFFSWLAYVVAYPMVLVFWKLPRLIWKQDSWNLIFATTNVVACTPT